MQVHGVGQTNPNAATGIAQRRDHSTQVPPNADAKPASTPILGEDASKVKGVIRLLQEGHFKGVADVRLRINFFDELQSLEHASLAEAASGNLSSLLDAENAKVDELVDAGELTSEQAASVGEAHDAFTTTVQQLVEDFQNGGATNTQPLLDGINAAFEEFIASLESIIAPPDASQDAETQTSLSPIVGDAVEATPPLITGESETPPAEGSILENFVADLRNVFNDALGEFNGGVNAATTLPPLSEPSGNGGAYAKFLAIYNDLLGATPNEPQGSAETTIDTQV
jgi:hypothetical protein